VCHTPSAPRPHTTRDYARIETQGGAILLEGINVSKKVRHIDLRVLKKRDKKIKTIDK
jgi:hypothetical protein